MNSYRPFTNVFSFLQHKRLFSCKLLLLTLFTFSGFYIINMYFQIPVNIYLTKSERCNGTLELPEEEIRKKISSYEFPGTDKYIHDLFPTVDVPDEMPDFPHFVTAISSNHYQEGLRMMYSLYAMLGERYPYLKLYVFDIGLSHEEQLKVREVCNCTFRTFPFDQYPDHVSILHGYAWKPLIIQHMIKEHPFVVWLDASIRFTTTNIDPLLDKAKKRKALSPHSKAKVISRTIKDTFEFLNEEPCLFKDVQVFEATLIVLYPSANEVNYLLKPWIACALVLGCMVTLDDPKLHSSCTSRENFACHRFDQAVWSILINRLYHKNAFEHIIAFPLGEYARRCRDCSPIIPT